MATTKEPNMADDDPKQDLRAFIVEALALALEPVQSDIRELQADVALALDKLDLLEVDMRDVKGHLAKLSRESIKERTARPGIERRLSAVERRLESLERKGDA